MEEEIFQTYSEWAQDELVWGKGMYNWCRAYSREEYDSYSMCDYDELLKVEIPY